MSFIQNKLSNSTAIEEPALNQISSKLKQKSLTAKQTDLDPKLHPNLTLHQNQAPKPFLQWVGGKRKIAGKLIELIPNDLSMSNNDYYEPFLGGGALFYRIKQSGMFK